MEKRIGIDITFDMIECIAKHIGAHIDETGEDESSQEALLLPVVELSVKQYQVTNKRGFVLSHRVASPYGFYYVAQADMEAALSSVPQQTQGDLARSLENYDPEWEAILVMLRPDEMQEIDIGKGGKLLLEGFLPRRAAEPKVEEVLTNTITTIPAQGPDLAQVFSDFIRATAEADARAILEVHPELLSDPEVERMWERLWIESPTEQQRVSAHHKLWKRKRRQHSRKEEKAHRAERYANATEEAQEIEWQPISQLPRIGSIINEMYKDDQDQHALYLEVREKPHVLDDASVNRSIRMYDERLDLIATMFGPQLERWRAEELTPSQRQEVERLVGSLANLKALDEKIIALLKEIKKDTLDAVMRKSDFELGFEKMYGKVPLTDKQQALAQKIDNWVKGIEARGGSDEQILQGMYDYMATFKQIMDSSSKVQMDKLCAQYPGFYRFASLLGALARGISDEVIDVP